MSWLSSFLHPGKGYEKGQEQLDKYWNQSNDFYNKAQGFQQPYNQMGMDAYGDYSDAMKKLLDPAALQDEWIKNYSQSESSKNAQGMAQEHGLDAASGLGLMGSSPALNAIQAGTTQIGLDDRQNYLDNLMQKYIAGTGIAGNIFGTGANAAGQMGNNAMQMGNNAMNMGQNSAGMAYGKQNAGGNMLAGLIGQGIGAVGGPIGGALSKRWNLSGGA